MNIVRKIKKYNFDKQIVKDNFVKVLSKNFYIELPDLLNIGEGELLRIDGALIVRIITASRNDNNENSPSLRSEGCFYYKDTNERILEIEFKTYRADKQKDMTLFLRLPLSAPFANGNVGIYFDGTWVRLMRDGFVLNEHSGYDLFIPETEAVFIRDDVKNFKFYEVLNKTINTVRMNEKFDTPYISPYWWNSNAGDVMNFYHDGVYHLIYLLDRRHHGSRNGCGSHYVAHITTSDFVNWEEQDDIVEIEAPWMTFGTGTMFFHNGKYYMSYGLHTERYTDNLEIPVIDQNSYKWNRVPYSQAFKSGKYPAGATYAYSDDGIHFTQSEILYHAGRNPSVYVDENNELKLYVGYGASGVWKAKNIEDLFYKSEDDFNFASGSIMRNSTECPSFFEWNGYKYLIIGFTGYFRTNKDSNDYFDAAANEEQIYDGLCVPMVTDFKDNRKIISGWLNGVGWASVIVHRELIQEENGKLGMKWVEEMTSDITNGKPKIIKSLDSYNFDCNYNYYFDINLEAKEGGKFSVFFLHDAESGCELQFDLSNNRMQFCDFKDGSFGEPLETMKEKMEKVDPSIISYHHIQEKDIPMYSYNYALSDIPYGVNNRIKFICSYIRKINSTIIDVEIGGKRTAVSLRGGLTVKMIQSKIESVVISKIKVVKSEIPKNDVLCEVIAQKRSIN